MRTIIAAILNDACSAVSRDGFFEAGSDARAAFAREAAGDDAPMALVRYLSTVSSDQFLADVQGATAYLRRRTRAKGNGLLGVAAEFLAVEFADLFDGLGSGFFALSRDARRDALAGGPIPGDGHVRHTLRETLSRRTPHQVASAIRRFLSDGAPTPFVLVQTARESDPVLRRQVRRRLRDGLPGSFPVFAVDRELGGGMRVFADGKMTDGTWSGSVRYIFRQ